MSRRKQGGRALVYKLCSLALQYPDEELLAGREELTAAAAALPPGRPATSLRGFFAWFGSSSPRST
jgi:nitrate reductase molybdenum cofactor assembly chaperone NarJ/NarW